MANHALIEFEAETFQLFMRQNILPGPGWAPYGAEGLALAREVEFDCDAGAEKGSCLKGFLVAIGLETLAAFSIFGVWHLWYILR